MPQWLQIVALVASPIFAAGGAWAAVRIELKYLRRDVDLAHTRLDDHDDLIMDQLRLTGL